MTRRTTRVLDRPTTIVADDVRSDIARVLRERTGLIMHHNSADTFHVMLLSRSEFLNLEHPWFAAIIPKHEPFTTALGGFKGGSAWAGLTAQECLTACDGRSYGRVIAYNVKLAQSTWRIKEVTGVE